MSAEQVIRLVNACNPWNKGAGAVIRDWVIGITGAEAAGDCDADHARPGTILACNEEEGLLIKTADQKKIKVTIIYTNEGFFPGYRLAAFGIGAGMVFV